MKYLIIMNSILNNVKGSLFILICFETNFVLFYKYLFLMGENYQSIQMHVSIIKHG